MSISLISLLSQARYWWPCHNLFPGLSSISKFVQHTHVVSRLCACRGTTINVKYDVSEASEECTL